MGASVFVTERELATRLGVDVYMIRRWEGFGYLPRGKQYSLGRALRWRRDELDAIERRCRQKHRIGA